MSKETGREFGESEKTPNARLSSARGPRVTDDFAASTVGKTKNRTKQKRTLYSCVECGFDVASWTGQCPGCNSWATLKEVAPGSSSPAGQTKPNTGGLKRLSDVDWELGLPLPTGLDEVDRVIGGGLTAGSVTLLAGEPGMGKSTLTLQIAASVANSGSSVVLVTGEEGPQQVAGRASRIGQMPKSLYFLDEIVLDRIESTIRSEQPQLIVVDSIQTLVDTDLSQQAGSIQQVKACANRLINTAKEFGVSIILIGHVTKEGSVAGPKVLEHAVDTVLNFDGDKQSQLRFLRASKNRFGTTAETGIFDMTGAGLVPVQDPSMRCLQDRQFEVPGSIVVPCLSGRRPVLAEVQALAAKRDDKRGRLSVQGVDGRRADLVLAVLSARAGYGYLEDDLFVSIAGGIKVSEPAMDLPVLLAIGSAIDGRPIAQNVVACGEIGLGGEVRNVSDIELRLQEAHRMGFRVAVVPKTVDRSPSGLELIRVANVAEALETVPRAQTPKLSVS